MLFNLTSLQVQGNMDVQCSVYTPVEESSTETKLKRLMEKEVQHRTLRERYL
jgi:hypothetical protein